MFVDEKYDYIKIDKDYFNKVKNDISSGLGTSKNLILYLLKYKNDINNKYIKRIELLDGEKFDIPDDYEIYCKYYMNKLSYNDKNMEENEIFDCYKIDDIGYYEITSYYKDRNIKIDKDNELIQKCLNYEKNYNKRKEV